MGGGTYHIDNGEFVFGSYCYEDYGKRDARLGILHAIIDEGGEEFIVDADSIAQLVSYDANGNEVYEGDTVTITRSTQTYKVGTEFTARRGAYVVDDIRSIMHFISEDFKLKEDAK